jgi:hypothetical protein
MVWTKYPTREDVSLAFKKVNETLNASPLPMFVIVDICCDPKFPVTATLSGALFGPQSNKKLRGWLVIGTSVTARFIDRTLVGATGRSLVDWFDDDAGVEAFLAQSPAQFALRA